MRRGHDRGRGRRGLGLLRHRIGLGGQAHAARANDIELVTRACIQTRHEELPDARRKTQAHGMATRIPRIEVADHRHALGVGRPHREAHARDAVDRHDVGAERLGQLEMPAFIEQMQIELAQQRAEGIGILGLLHRCRPLDAQQIGRGVRHRAFEQARHLAFDQPAERRSIAATQHLDRLRARQEGADDAAGRAVMRTQHLEGIAMARRRQRFGVADDPAA